MTLNFQFPALSADEAKTAYLAAYYYDSPTTIKVLQQQPIGAYSYSNPNYSNAGGPLSSATLSLYGFEALLNAGFTVTFDDGWSHGHQHALS